ncbi:MAG: HEPN domain-containing protein [Candidatus Woesearchaeota archaeon]
MTELDFLNKLKKEGKLELVDPSQEISKAYLIKSDNCIRSSKYLFEKNIYENAVAEAYFGIYNSLLSLLFKCGIKSETHAGSIILLRRIFGLDAIAKIVFDAKKERIDNQYYVTDNINTAISRDYCKRFISSAEKIVLELRSYAARLTEEKINVLRNRFKRI